MTDLNMKWENITHTDESRRCKQPLNPLWGLEHLSPCIASDASDGMKIAENTTWQVTRQNILWETEVSYIVDFWPIAFKINDTAAYHPLWVTYPTVCLK